MKRKDFLKGLGLAGIGTAIAKNDLLANTSKTLEETPPGGACTLIPSETAGPFPLDLTENTKFFRKAINETKTGTPLNVKIKIIGQDNCQPMQNARVNIWHCDKDGLYSGYSQTNNQGQAGLTYCRGYQFTDANGVVEFTTIFPGWYSGRICHIHFQVYVSSSYSAVSQLTFPVTTKNAIYSANSSLYTKGADPMSLTSDNIFSDGYAFQMATLTQNASGGYDAYLEVTVKGSGTVGLGHIEKENAKQFSLAQNFPNPFTNETTIPFKLINPSNVKILLFDLNGRNVATILDSDMEVGEHQIPLNLNSLGLPNANYAYQIEVKNSDGIFKDVKMMTAAQ